MNRFATLLIFTALTMAPASPCLAQTTSSTHLQILYSGGPSGGALIGRADAERYIQAREDRLKPTALRQDFTLNPQASSGWVFSRKLLLEFLLRMRDKSDDAKIYFSLGHAERLDANRESIPGTWRETLVILDAQPFTSLATDAGVYAQHPNDWP